jgi:alpha-galactosidase
MMMGLFSSKKVLKTAVLFVPVLCLWITGLGQSVPIRNHHLEIQVNTLLQTKVAADYSGSRPLMNGFTGSEWLETKYFTAKEFSLLKKTKTPRRDTRGNGTEWLFSGMDVSHQIEKILRVKCYDQFPDAAYISVAYVNHGKKNLTVKKWVNHAYEMLPSTDSIPFWSFQGSSHSDRRDWIQPVRAGFGEQNFMGMNASDYGGGIPLIDMWRRDGGLAIARYRRRRRSSARWFGDRRSR